MDKEEKDRGIKEEKDMQSIMKKQPTFADFINNNKNKIHKIIDSNTTKNNDGLTVITKDDPWREEVEWDQLDKDSKK